MESLCASIRDSDHCLAEGFAALFALPQAAPATVPRRSILIKRSRYENDDDDDDDESSLPRSASHARVVQFNLDDTQVFKVEKVTAGQRQHVWYTPREEAAMFRAAALPRFAGLWWWTTTTTTTTTTMRPPTIDQATAAATAVNAKCTHYNRQICKLPIPQQQQQQQRMDHAVGAVLRILFVLLGSFYLVVLEEDAIQRLLVPRKVENSNVVQRPALVVQFTVEEEARDYNNIDNTVPPRNVETLSSSSSSSSSSSIIIMQTTTSEEEIRRSDKKMDKTTEPATKEIMQITATNVVPETVHLESTEL